MTVTPFDPAALDRCQRSPRIEALRRVHFDAMPEICVERPRLLTAYYAEHGLFAADSVPILAAARAYRHVLRHRQPIVAPTRFVDTHGRTVDLSPAPLSLFAGGTTSKLKGVPLYPEFLALTLWPELRDLPHRPRAPYAITPEEVEELNARIFPRWVDSTIGQQALRHHSVTAPGDPHPGLLDGLEDPLRHLPNFLISKALCISHTIPDFRPALTRGLAELIEDAAEGERAAEDAGARDFYAAVGEVLSGVIEYAHRLAERAEELAGRERDPQRRAELLELAEIHRRVPEHPARTFREGLTTIWLCWTALLLENSNTGLSLGRLDQVLWDLYREDRRAGRLSQDEAVELCCALWLKLGDHVPAMPSIGDDYFGATGVNQAVTIGGVDERGRDAVNELTYVILRATELVLLRDPNLNARYYPGVNGPRYLRRLCQANVDTGATPALHNDRAVIQALMRKGETLQQARDYGIVGCVEPTSAGRTYGHSAAILMNLASALEATLFDGRHRATGPERPVGVRSGDPRTFSDFPAFQEAFTRQLRWLADKSAALNNAFGRIHQRYHPTPILSSLLEGPLREGRDAVEGGATINYSGVAIIGFADVVDSLSAIQTVVFDERAVDMATLLEALRCDFRGFEALQCRLANAERTPKYGTEHPTAIANADWLIRLLDAVFDEKTNYRGGRYRVGYWSMTTHVGWGRLLGALPSGRRARTPFASGLTPVSGLPGSLTATLNALAELPTEHIASGAAINITYTPADREGAVRHLTSAVEGYFAGDEREGAGGGAEVQFIVRDRESLREAMRRPEAFPDLLVRVSGYTAYFKDLSPEMQREILRRTEYLMDAPARDGLVRLSIPLCVT